MLELHDVHSGYGRTEVIHGVSMTVPDDSVVAIMGHNGAGKTTLLRTAVGLLPTKSGTITFDGEAITKLSPSQRVKRGIGYVPQGQQSFGQLTTAENLQVVADGRKRGKALYLSREIEQQRAGDHEKRRSGIQPKGRGRGEGIAGKPLQHAAADGGCGAHIDGNQRRHQGK